MSTKPRAITTKIDIEAGTLSITTDLGAIVVEPREIHQDMVTYAALHGFKQKICDSAALGAGATLTEKWNAMKETFDRLNSAEPTWNKGSDGTTVRGGLLYLALCRMKPTTDKEAIKGYIEKLDKKQQAALRKDPAINSIIEEIKAERVDTSSVDTSALLAGLDDI